MSVENGKLLWHLTALENIESIFKNGLSCRKKLISKSFVDIADTNILESRAKFGLENYIPFHFMQKTPFAGKVMKDNKDSLYTIDKAIEDIKYAFDELKDVEQRYDYNKLPKGN